MKIQNRYSFTLATLLSLPLAATGCGGGDDDPTPHDPATAEHAEIDRFSEAAGHLQVRTAENGLPGPNEPIDFDSGPFITRGLGPNGESVRYYNFDVQPLAPAPIFALFREGESAPVEGQLNIVGVIPGDEGYNDFWLINKVIVPKDYVANTVASVAEIEAAGYEVEVTNEIVNCPIVPLGSTARLRGAGESAGLVQGWYEGTLVHYFHFGEAPLSLQGGQVPVAPIYVTFNKNPDDSDPASGPASGFLTEGDTDQTHNVLTALPSDGEAYSPLWAVSVYDNAGFDAVVDLASLESTALAQVLARDVAIVNCPVVEITN